MPLGETVPDLRVELSLAFPAADLPLKVARDKDTGRDYLLCFFNRDGDSYRFIIAQR